MASEQELFGAAAEKSEVTILPKASQGELREICCRKVDHHKSLQLNYSGEISYHISACWDYSIGVET